MKIFMVYLKTHPSPLTHLFCTSIITIHYLLKYYYLSKIILYYKKRTLIIVHNIHSTCTIILYNINKPASLSIIHILILFKYISFAMTASQGCKHSWLFTVTPRRGRNTIMHSFYYQTIYYYQNILRLPWQANHIPLIHSQLYFIYLINYFQ